MSTKKALNYKRAIALAFMTTTAITIAGPADAQSFNCRFARTSDEVLICQNSELGRLDERMSDTYYSLRNRLSGQQLRRLDTIRNYWISERQMCGRNAKCIENVYIDWISKMEELE